MAGVTAASDEVATGHQVVREIATSGTPVPPAPVVHPLPARSNPGPARQSGTGRRPGRPAVTGRDSFAYGAAKPARRTQSAHRPQNAGRPQDAKRSA